jgi:hypothetical protein
VILASLFVAFMHNDAKERILAISTGAGVITEFVASVFFWLYSRTVSQLRAYHDSLVSIQNVLLSFKLVADTADAAEKARMVSRMCTYLLTAEAGGLAQSFTGNSRKKRAKNGASPSPEGNSSKSETVG